MYMSCPQNSDRASLRILTKRTSSPWSGGLPCWREPPSGTGSVGGMTW